MGFQCPVCGYQHLQEPPRGPSTGGSYEICPSCGFQFGVSDEDEGKTYEQWRDDWIASGMPWSSVSQIPQQPPWRWLKEQFEASTGDARIAWLARLMFAVSMMARSTYEVGDDVEGPRKLRRFNEVLHRVATNASALCEGSAMRLPDEALIALVIRELAAMNVDAEVFRSIMGHP